ncbi:TonB-dependent receptor plug domain-containing protein [Thiococcus pfennigii]|uniref:TonB-dependent receptor plug domain-containing protein n=1 Tax=Thiococcus pfennigii TaxID=1057 RepID=UPI0019069718|nr:TonB-dependent receptor [Thiococcus pfennigii]MBK1730552.1 hypothetical protein [Thiococcus pfennigii]
MQTENRERAATRPLAPGRSGRRPGWLIPGILLSAAAPLAAEEPLSAVTLDTLSVTATRSATAIEALPGPIQIFDRDDIERLDARRLSEVLRLAQGVHIQKKGTRDTVSIRGFTNEQTLILIDGRRLASEPSQKFELDRITLENVERIEIVRGPSSALYGADALGGVINVITRRPEAATFQFRSRCGQFELGHEEGCEGGFYGAIRPSANLGLSLSGTRIDQPGVTLDSGASLVDDEDLVDFTVESDWRMNEALRLIATAKYLHSDSHFLAESGGGKLTRTDEDDERTDLALSLDYAAEDREGRLQLYYSRLDKDREQRLEGTGKLQEFDEVRVEKTSADGQYSWFLAPPHRITVGGDYRIEAFRGTTIATGQDEYQVTREGLTATGSEAHIDYWAVFAQDQWQVAPRLNLVLGGRLDGSDQFDNEPTGKLGVVYDLVDRPDAALQLKGQVAQGYRVPTVRDLYVNVTKGSFTRIGNPDLEPEHSRSLDLALEGRYERLRGRLGLFHNEVEDLIAERTIGTRPDGRPIRQYRNVDEATLRGLEAGLGWQSLGDLAVDLDYMYLDARDEGTDSRLEDRPRHRFVTTLRYDYQRWGLGLTLSGDYNLDVLDASSGKEKDYGVWDLDIAQPLTEQLDLRLGVENLFDERDADLLLAGRFLYIGLNGAF